MEILSVHVCFEVADFGRALAFWQPAFAAAGFAPDRGDGKHYGGFTNGPFSLILGLSDPARVSRKAPTGDEFVVTDHVGFKVATRAEVDAIAAAMAASGAVPLFPAKEYAEFGPGFYGVTWCDADGNVIEFGCRT